MLKLGPENSTNQCFSNA